jgi:glucose-6-phosphate 1-epimerase
VHQQQSKLVTIKNVSNQTDVYSSGHDSIVVWNPWQEKSANMADMADDSYLTMVCVETAITQGQSVNPGETHILEQAIS